MNLQNPIGFASQIGFIKENIIMKTQVKNRHSGWIALLVGLILILTCSMVYQTLTSSSDLKNHPPSGSLVNVGDHRLHIHCTGQGSPTVIMEAGMSGWSTDWILVQPQISKTTRVCSYDRAGYGWSESGSQPRDSQQVSSELHSLLVGAEIQGKYLLVGHSLGGLFVQMYAKRYPKEIAGIVLVDSVHQAQSMRMKENVRRKFEGDLTTLTRFSSIVAPTGLLRLTNQPETIIADKLPRDYQNMTRAMGFQTKAYRALADEMAAFQASQLEVQRAGLLPNVPITVLSSTAVRDFPPGFSANQIKGLWDELQQELPSQATSAIHVIAKKSGHYIHLDQPELVIEAVVNMVKKTRNQKN
jgi:pimeloyl-ACP methyl ester carboxylesterase